MMAGLGLKFIKGKTHNIARLSAEATTANVMRAATGPPAKRAMPAASNESAALAAKHFNMKYPIRISEIIKNEHKLYHVILLSSICFYGDRGQDLFYKYG